MNNVQPFDFHGVEVRVVEAEGVTWFVAGDVAKAMGYAKPRKAISDHCLKQTYYYNVVKSAPIGGATPPPIGITLHHESLLIPESDIYRLVVKSRLPAAVRFEKWVMEDVLPTIRATGKYEVEQNKELAIPDFSDPAAAARAWANEY